MSETTKTTKPPPVATKAIMPKKSFMTGWYLQYYRSVTIAVCVVIIAVGYFFIISPKLNNARNIANVILIESKNSQEILKKRFEYLANLEAKRSQMSEADLIRFNEMLPSEPSVPAIFASLEGIGRESGAIIQNIELAEIDSASNKKRENPEAETDVEAEADILPNGVKVLEIQISVAITPYGDLKNLVKNIEKSLRLMDVVSLLYTPSSQTYNLTVLSYYLES